MRPPEPTITAVQPSRSAAGAQVLVTGTNFETAAAIKVGGVKLDNLIIAPDGTSASGVVPKLGLAPGTVVDVTLRNGTNGTSFIFADQFSYGGDTKQ
jgi:hypothetical protein